MSETLTVRFSKYGQPENMSHVIGPRSNMVAAFKKYGSALWLKADGSATLYYTANGKKRQHTWSSIHIVRAEDGRYGWKFMAERDAQIDASQAIRVEVVK